MKKAKKALLIALPICILLSVLIYMKCIRTWQVIVKADTEIDAMRNITYFDGKGLDDRVALLGTIKKVALKGKIVDDNQSMIMKEGFARDSSLLYTEDSKEKSKPYLKIDYYFGYNSNTSGDSFATVYIIPQSDFEYSLFSGLTMDYSGIKEYDRFDNTYSSGSDIRLLTKHKDEGRFRYFISPLIAGWDYFLVPSTWGGEIHMIFVYGDYTIYIIESSHEEVKDYKHRYKNVIKDLGELIEQAQAELSENTTANYKLTVDDFKTIKFGDKYDDVVKAVGQPHLHSFYESEHFYYYYLSNSYVAVIYDSNIGGISSITHCMGDESDEEILISKQ